MPDPAEPLLKVRGLVAGYGGTPILRGIDLVVGKGEVVAVLGANGVGKTTLNKALSGVVATDAGEIEFARRRIAGLPPTEIVALGLVQVPEGRRIFPNLSVRENLELGSYRRAKAGRARNLERVFGIFPRLEQRHTQRAGTLSGGEQQMLAIGRGLMAEPVLLVLDEPSLGLSPLLVDEMFALIRTISAEGLSVLLVEQNVMQSLQIANRAYVLENGQVVVAGDAKVLAADPALEKAYLGM
jgi:branched-chain amino acid transport system ATP-binding protein